MSYYNLVKLAEDKKNNESFIGSRDHLIGTAGGAALGAGIYDRATKPKSYKEIANIFESHTEPNLLSKQEKAFEDVYKNTYPDADLSGNDYKKALNTHLEDMKQARSKYMVPELRKEYDSLGSVDKFIAGKMKDTDDPAEILQRLAKRKDLITKGLIGAGAGALGYGAYKAIKHAQGER